MTQPGDIQDVIPEQLHVSLQLVDALKAENEIYKSNFDKVGF